ncbi:hypothetical protein LPJ66_007256 [Kickxella alabastrina]|uniref:Uncharacterized protein n=1 Tax=Kickxella alabastrina TaxID=61397 RepID=A0ACC1IDD2_9FUNG|nr:hypothetical protein LPJ66_007256 [Kickxella alabastrina]
MVSVSTILMATIAAPMAMAQYFGGGAVYGLQSVSSGSYYNSATTSYATPGYGGIGYGGYGGYGSGYGGYGVYGSGYGGYGGYGSGYGGLGYLGTGAGYGYGRGVAITGASTGGAAIIGPSGSIIVGPQSAGGIYL